MNKICEFSGALGKRDMKKAAKGFERQIDKIILDALLVLPNWRNVKEILPSKNEGSIIIAHVVKGEIVEIDCAINDFYTSSLSHKGHFKYYQYWMPTKEVIAFLPKLKKS